MASQGRTKITTCRARVIATRSRRRCRVMRPAPQVGSRSLEWCWPSTMTTASNSLPLHLCMFISVAGWGSAGRPEISSSARMRRTVSAAPG